LPWGNADAFQIDYVLPVPFITYHFNVALHLKATVGIQENERRQRNDFIKVWSVPVQLRTLNFYCLCNIVKNIFLTYCNLSTQVYCRLETHVKKIQVVVKREEPRAVSGEPTFRSEKAQHPIWGVGVSQVTNIIGWYGIRSVYADTVHLDSTGTQIWPLKINRILSKVSTILYK
jgi:hypothetical protein